MDDIISASRPSGPSRRPRTSPDGRICASVRCDTLLSRYNRSPLCNRHKPIKYPRIRGVLTDDG